MAELKHAGNPWWTILLPLASAALIALYFGGLLPKEGALRIAIEAVLLCGAIFAAVHHAEVVSARVGGPGGAIHRAGAGATIVVGRVVGRLGDR
ncbi:MAG: ionic transporter y4hA, partial [Rhabdaerophilum sp.]